MTKAGPTTQLASLVSTPSADVRVTLGASTYTCRSSPPIKEPRTLLSSVWTPPWASKQRRFVYALLLASGQERKQNDTSAMQGVGARRFRGRLATPQKRPHLTPHSYTVGRCFLRNTLWISLAAPWLPLLPSPYRDGRRIRDFDSVVLLVSPHKSVEGTPVGFYEGRKL